MNKRYKIFLTKQAEKSLLKIKKADKATAIRISNNIDVLSKNPVYGVPLTGALKGFWKLRVGIYRIIYWIEKDKLVVNVISIAHRKDVYR